MTHKFSESIIKLFRNSWWEMNWFCGVSSVLCRADANHHISDDWQLSWDSYKTCSLQLLASSFVFTIECIRRHLWYQPKIFERVLLKPLVFVLLHGWKPAVSYTSQVGYCRLAVLAQLAYSNSPLNVVMGVKSSNGDLKAVNIVGIEHNTVFTGNIFLKVVLTWNFHQMMVTTITMQSTHAK